MSARNLLIAASVIATGFAGGLALAQPSVNSAATQPGAPAPAAHSQRADRLAPGRFIEGRIAFLKTELKLTPQQQPLFDKLADEMRASTKTLQERHAQRQQVSAPVQSTSALEKLEKRSAAMKEMTAAQDRYLSVFRPFYQSLSADQQKTADQLFARHGMEGHFGKPGPRHH